MHTYIYIYISKHNMKLLKHAGCFINMLNMWCVLVKFSWIFLQKKASEWTLACVITEFNTEVLEINVFTFYGRENSVHK